MILILSENRDPSTTDVMEWIVHNGYPVLRRNFEDISNDLTLELGSDKQDFQIKYKNALVNLNEITAFWYRRGNITREISKLKDLDFAQENQDEKLVESLHATLNKEWLNLRKHVHFLLDTKHSLGNHLLANINKLNCLYNAQRWGLDIPETIVTTNKASLEKFFQKHTRIVTKAIQDIHPIQGKDKNDFFSAYTERIKKDEIEKMPEKFFPALFQEQLDKAYELRIFYLAGKLYPMAIFSQLDDQTSLDFRHYNRDKPNRYVPYNLPKTISAKIRKLMTSLQLDTGSIDFVVTDDNRYVFLEVNPVGQFGMTSFPCNYYLEKKIADYLTKKENTNGKEN